MDISWKQAFLAAMAMTLIAAVIVTSMETTAAVIRPSAFAKQPTPAPTAQVKQDAKVKVIERVKVQAVASGQKPDGYLSRDQCFAIPQDMQVNEVVYRFGWPSGANGRAMGLGEAEYPIREDHGATCKVFFPYGTVSTVLYRKDANDYGGTETWHASS